MGVAALAKPLPLLAEAKAIYNLMADDFIPDHGPIWHEPVLNAVLAAVAFAGGDQATAAGGAG